MATRIAVIADLHLAEQPVVPERRGDLGEVLLARAVHRINTMIQPDVTVVAGDMVDEPDPTRAAERLARLQTILAGLKSPAIVLPGNHDPAPELFYRTVPKPPEFLDAGGIRFVWFIDPEAPGWWARRTDENLARMAAARVGFDGPLVAIQHVPVFPLGASGARYDYVNADAVLETMQRCGYILAISGHEHRGMDLLRVGRTATLAGPALCEDPFPFLEVVIDGADIRVTRHELAMPKAWGLVDTHVHTHFALCSENMNIGRAKALAEAFHLGGLIFAEHATHLYFSRDAVNRGVPLREGIERRDRQDGVAAYLEALEAESVPAASRGLEVDCDLSGRPVVLPEDLRRVDYRLGAIHVLASLAGEGSDPSAAVEEYLGLLNRFIASGIRALAHPFRVFRRWKQAVPERLFDPVVELLRRHGVAAEINFHTDEPPPEFFRRCLRGGVKMVLGSDAHNLREVGEFAPHLALLAECGVTGDPRDVLLG